MAHKAPHDVLSECLERWENGQGGVEELLAQRPELRADLNPLLQLAAQLRAQPAVRAPERLRRDPLWRRGLADPTGTIADVCTPRPTTPAASLEPHDALALALERWERGEPGVEAVLAQHPEVQPLVELAVELWSTPPVQAPARLRQDPLWRRAATPADATVPEPVSLPLVSAPRPAAPAASLEPHDALALALERCERGEPDVDAMLAQHPEVEPLVALAVELRSIPPVQAPARLLQDPLWRRAAAAAEATPPDPVSLPLWAAARREDITPAASFAPSSRNHRKLVIKTLSRLAAGVGGAGLALLLAGGLATSTATSLPDEPLYPVKRLVEDAQLAVAPPQARLEIRLQRAQERMKETREMVERDRADVVASLATDYVREVDAVRTELHNPQGQVAAPDQVGRVITRLEANEQMLGAIVERVPEPARPAVARAVEVSRPDSVSTSSAPVAPSAPAAVVAPPAAPEPAAVAPLEPAAPAAILPVAAPTFGPRPQSAALPSRTEPQSITGSAPSTDPGRVAIPNGAGAAPAVLPPANSAGPAPQAPASTNSGARSAAPGTAGSITGSNPNAITPSGAAAPSLGTSGNPGAVTGGSQPTAPASSAANSPSAGPGSAPASVTGGSSATAPAGNPASAAPAGNSPATTGAASTPGGAANPSSTQRAPSFDAPPAQATAVPPSPTPVFQLLPPVATPTRANP